jgi:hypothetical protein
MLCTAIGRATGKGRPLTNASDSDDSISTDDDGDEGYLITERFTWKEEAMYVENVSRGGGDLSVDSDIRQRLQSLELVAPSKKPGVDGVFGYDEVKERIARVSVSGEDGGGVHVVGNVYGAGSAAPLGDPAVEVIEQKRGVGAEQPVDLPRREMEHKEEEPDGDDDDMGDNEPALPPPV